MIKVVHLTSAHPRYDIRIFEKECRSLAQAGFNVTLVVADGLPNETLHGVNIASVGPAGSRWKRMTTTARHVASKALSLKADIYHLHDPELLPHAKSLSRQGAAVIFDAHEDLPKQVRSKPYLPFWVKGAASAFSAKLEQHFARHLTGVVGATPNITQKFSQFCAHSTTIHNYPTAETFNDTPPPYENRPPFAVYVGGLTKLRGITEIVTAVGLSQHDCRLLLAGDFSNSDFEQQLRKLPGWEKVDYFGYLSREEIHAIFEKSRLGLVLLHPTVNYVEALPIKLFEYMAAGIPVLASNFPLWENIINTHKCGICVNPLNPAEIAQAIDYLLSDPNEAKRMGQNGYRAMREHFNWATEASGLVQFYKQVLPNKDSVCAV
jgi:glycosyltransferase involved in cell wall biosynthesis